MAGQPTTRTPLASTGARRSPAIRSTLLAEAVRHALVGAIGLSASLTAGAQLFPATLSLSSLDGTNGFTLDGEIAGNGAASVSNAGDVNGDGIDDLLIGAIGADPNGTSSGRSYVVFGRNAAIDGNFPVNFQLSALDGSNGFAIDGEFAYDLSGRAVSAVGDLNGDGVDDFAIGARDADPNGARSGRTYVVFGRDVSVTGDFPATLQLSALDGSNGIKLDGQTTYDLAGTSVSSAGDINNDGFDDLIVGALGADPNGAESGRSYVLYGKDAAASGNFPAVLQLSSLNGTDGFVINGEAAGDYAGTSVDSAGDINGDGIGDLVIGAQSANVNGNRSGRTHVVFGRDAATVGNFPSPLELSGLNGADGFELRGEAAFDFSGGAVSGAGDVNGDGYDDLLIGARRSDANGDSSGRSYVVFGREVSTEGAFPVVLELSTLDGTAGFRLDGAFREQAGTVVDGAGDVNGDGFPDLIIGAETASVNSSYEGRSYVVFGRDAGAGDPFPATLLLAAMNGGDGFSLIGENNSDNSGNSVTGTGDINGDGVDDIAVTASEADPNGSNSGRTYVIFGRRLNSDLSVRMRDCRDPARPGGEIEYGFSIRNAGPDDALDVLLESALPAGLSFSSASPVGLCSDNSGSVTCDIGSLPAGSSLSLGWLVSVDLGVSGPITTSVAVSTLNEDPPSNNLASETTQVLADLIFFDSAEKCLP